MPRLDPTNSMQQNKHSSRRIYLFYFTLPYAFFNNRCNTLAVRAALVLKIRKLRIGKMLPFSVAHIYLLEIMDHLPDMEAKYRFYLGDCTLIGCNQLVHVLGKLVGNFKTYFLEQLCLGV